MTQNRRKVMRNTNITQNDDTKKIHRALKDTKKGHTNTHSHHRNETKDLEKEKIFLFEMNNK